MALAPVAGRLADTLTLSCIPPAWPIALKPKSCWDILIGLSPMQVLQRVRLSSVIQSYPKPCAPRCWSSWVKSPATVSLLHLNTPMFDCVALSVTELAHQGFMVG